MLAGALLLLLAYGALNDPPVRGLHPTEFWAAKMAWRSCADLVLAGDSRTYVGVSPGAMRETLGDRRVLNFGFDNGGFSERYLDAIGTILDPASPARTVLLGVTPHSLSREATEDNWFERLRRDGAPRPHPLKVRLARLLDRFAEPLPPDRAFRLLSDPDSIPRHEREYHADGWMASRLTPELPGKGLEVAAGWFRSGGVDESIVRALLERVGRWTSGGVRVCAFRPPTAGDLAAYEDRASGFDGREFARRFEEAGGRWLTLPPGDYHAYDGSHLDRDAAVTLGRDLARLLRRDP